MTTIQAMGKPPSGKNLVTVNGFKAPEEWYAIILKIAEERRSTVGGAIQHLVEIALPIYEAMSEAEQTVKRQRTEETTKSLKKKAG